MIYYHGSGEFFKEFDKKRIGQNYIYSENSGFFFTQKKQSAKNYAYLGAGGVLSEKPGFVFEVNLKFNNPLVIETNSDYYQPADIFDLRSHELVMEAKLEKKDSILIRGTRNDDLVIVFEPSQIEILRVMSGDLEVYSSVKEKKEDFEYSSLGM